MKDQSTERRIMDAFEEESASEEYGAGRGGMEVPRRVREIMRSRRRRPVPQSLAGVRGLPPARLVFAGASDRKPPSAIEPEDDGPLNREAVKAANVGMDALKFLK